MNTVALTGTFNTSDTGPSRVLEGLAGALADTGLEVHAFTHGDRDNHPHQDVHVSRFEKTPQSVPGFFSYFRWARSEIQDLNPDVIHPLEEYPFKADVRTVQWTSDSYERWRLCRDDFRGYGYFAGDVVLNVANRIGASRTGTVVASSPETARQMESYWRFSPDTVIPLGIDAETRTPPSEVSSPPRILLPGRITPKKGQREFLQELDSNSDEYQIDIVGGVSDEEYWNSLSEWHDCHHGFVERSVLEELYESADIVVVPSIHENFSLTALEGIAHSCVVIVTSRCGFAQFDWARPVNGIYTVDKPEDSGELAEELSGEVTISEKEAAFDQSLELTWERIADQYAKQYNDQTLA